MDKLKVEYVPVDSIKAYKNNAKIHTTEQIEQIKKSIAEFGMNDPIAVWKNNEIIEGHGRLEACNELGIKEVPIIRLDELTDDKRKAYALVHNQLTMNTGFDDDILNIELGDIDMDLGDFGFEEPIESDVEIIEDEPPEPPEEPFSRVGDLLHLGDHVLICGDSTDCAVVDRLMGGEKADMVFTDPPWNVNYGAVKEDNAMGYKPRTILNDHMETDEFKEFMLKSFSVLSGVSKDGAPTYIVMSAQEWGNMMLALAATNYHWSSTIIWNKDHLVLSRKDYHTKYEPIWYGWKGGAPRICPLRDRTQSDVWDFDRPTKSEEHPTMKPVPLVAKAVQNSSKGNDVVLDLFGGSGTTLIACEQLNRKCYMAELDPRYCDVIAERYIAFTGNPVKVIRDGKEMDYESKKNDH